MPTTLEYALAVLFAVRFYAFVKQSEALRFLVFALIAVSVVQDFRVLIWAMVFDAIVAVLEYVLRMLR